MYFLQSKSSFPGCVLATSIAYFADVSTHMTEFLMEMNRNNVLFLKTRDFIIQFCHTPEDVTTQKSKLQEENPKSVDHRVQE